MDLRIFIKKFKFSVFLLILEQLFFITFMINVFYSPLTSFNLNDVNCILIIFIIITSLLGLYAFNQEQNNERERALSQMATLAFNSHFKDKYKK